MLVNLLLLLFILFILFSYFGAKLHVKIKDFEHKYLFWILFVITFITVIEIIFCFMMWFKYKNKEGSIGPRGYQGEPGPQGDKGKCDKYCNEKLITLLIINMMEKNKDSSLEEDEKNNIYKNIKNLNNTHKTIYGLTQKQVNNLYIKLKNNYTEQTNLTGIISKANFTENDLGKLKTYFEGLNLIK